VDGLLAVVFRLSSMPAVQRAGLAALADTLAIALGLGFVALAVRGWLRAGTGLDRAAAWVTVLYLLQLCVWPYALGARAIFVVLPFALRWFWLGFTSLPWSGPWRQRVTIALVVFLAANALVAARSSAGLARLYADERDFTTLRELAGWLRTEVPPEAPVAASRFVPLLQLHHLSGRTFLANLAPDPNPQFWSDVNPATQTRTAAWFVTRIDDSDLARLQSQHPLTPAREFGRWRVWKVEGRK